MRERNVFKSMYTMVETKIEIRRQKYKIHALPYRDYIVRVRLASLS